MNQKLRITLDWVELPFNLLSMFIFNRKNWNLIMLNYLETDKKFPQWRRESKPVKIVIFFLKLKLKK